MLTAIDLSFLEFLFFCGIILFASTVRGFSGFGFSASSVSLLSFILPPKEIVPIILLLEITASFFMIPSIWKKINWKFVVYLLVGVSIGTPFGVHLLSILEPRITHLIISIFTEITFDTENNSKTNDKTNDFFIFIAAEPAVIRASLAALFFFTDLYAFVLAYFNEILSYKVIYRTLPLILIVPFGVSIGTKLFTGSTKENYKKYVLYFLILVSIFGLIRSLI